MKFPTDSTDTPERVEFENLDFDNEDDGNVSRNEMDEDEWTDHNFGTSANELASSDDVSDLRCVLLFVENMSVGMILSFTNQTYLLTQ